MTKTENRTAARWFHRVGNCFGVTLWRRPHVELWVCFSGVGEHRHPGQAVEVLPLFGWAKFYRALPGRGNVPEEVEIRARSWWRLFTVPEGWPHWFELRRRWLPLVFLNVTEGGSAAENFVE